MKLNPDTESKILTSSWQVPVFLIGFSPYCGHCKAVLPYWEKLKEKYENDKHILISELNCVDFRDMCRNKYKVGSYPSFKVIKRGQIEGVHPANRNLEGFDKIATELRQQNMDEMCNQIAFMPKDVSYPYFIYHTTENIKTACKFMESLERRESIKPFRKQIFTDANATNTYFEAILSPNTSLNMSGFVETYNIESFVEEYKYKNFQQIPWVVAFSRKRPIALLVNSTTQVAPQFENLSNTSPKYYWIAITSKAYNSNCPIGYNITDNDLPAIWFSNPKKNKGKLLLNATVESINDILGKDPKNLPEMKAFKFKNAFARSKIVFNTIDYVIFAVIGVSVATILFAIGFIIYELRNSLKIE